jgi:hypothetical protein
MAVKAGPTHMRAHAMATRDGTDVIARRLQEALGQRVTALAVGLRDPKAIGRWARGENRPTPDAEERLRLLDRIVTELSEVEAHATIRAWLVGMEPRLGDRSPAVVLCEGDGEAVLAAARSFIDEG